MRWIPKSLRIPVLLTALALLASACGTSDTVTGVATAERPGSVVTQSLFGEVVTPLGGNLVGDSAKLVVPAGALGVATSLSLQTSVVSGCNQAEFGPDGQQFAEPCTLSIRIPSGQLPGQVFHIFWWNPATSAWVDLGGTTSQGWVSVQISHFSTYKAAGDLQ